MPRSQSDAAVPTVPLVAVVTSTVAMIPTLGRSPYLAALVETVSAEADEVWVYDNGSPENAGVNDLGMIPGVTVHDMDCFSFYAMWNTAITRARMLYDEANLAIVNDDIEMDHRTLPVMRTWLRLGDTGIVSPATEDRVRTQPTYNGREVVGTYKDHGINGACFMVRAETCPLVDDRFALWYGDDDLVAKVIASGQRAVCIEGLGILHHRSTTLATVPGHADTCARDAARWKELHP